MDYLAGQALRRIQQAIRSTFYPADYRTAPRATSSNRPIARARLARPDERDPSAPPPPQLFPSRYVMSQNMRQARRRYWAFLILALALLVLFLVCLGLNIPLRSR